ncbi:tRNA pseudouridine(38-40) synthase TruA [Stenotrophomonas rhizophila]|jgi:tRNA pseudouridine38-40 synthase|uniref:tRNA pseudouridine(38-40) synthase TruA n=1 Tax=Stenotrophomonas rhizophila TaxID=216778 RepID=UPI000456A113|nr:tRNA pseudouridine(38-40) synthase TruA [Stenotrophomonas rhizophila]AHY58284.1 tRNA pseudouridine synthase A [Stenotrophomonas rhizophila]MDY0954264.1 tRNA pseudouridine(38-40) synthase TruA [Stenotrophomonas rhizophila]TKK03034.1 tRNA pseudouridine(38-40) synthase TruA [Stenotrophomonas rhizophila]
MRYAMGVEYDGSEFKGWQQLGESGRPSVQASLQQALSSVADAPIKVMCAGRTDAGVHGHCQVVHFDTDVVRNLRGWTLGTTTRLPPAIAVRWCQPVADDFHARFSARARRYRYRLLNRQVRPALNRQSLSWERRPLDAALMHAAAQALLGENDFSAFRSVNCEALHARRELQAISVTRDGEVLEVCVQANAFLHHMVRNIVGSLILVGCGDKPVSWLGELLAGKDRTVAGPTAPPQGLVFVGPLYPDNWQLPAEVTL